MTTAAERQRTGSESAAKHRAGALDIRTIIGALIGVYGVVLVVMALVHYPHSARIKTGGVNANLWAGLVMLVVAVGFLLWVRLRPIVVDPAAIDAED